MASNRDRTLIASAFAGTILTCAGGFAQAQDKPPCEQFDWSIKREQAIFGTAGLKSLPSGGSLGEPGGAALQLVPNASVPFVLPPGRQPKSAESFGAILGIALPKAGAYQVTLSNEAWIDVIQDGHALDSTSHSGKRGCADVRKSVRFNLQPGKATIQLSGAPANAIDIAILPAE